LRLCVAQIGAAQGIRGEVRVRAFTEDAMAIAAYGPLETENGSRRFEIEAIRPVKDHLVVRFKGVSDRNAAEQLRNLKLFVARDKLPETEDADTFYHADLIGLAASTGDGRTFGTVVAVHNFGAGDLLEIRPAAGGPTLLLSFTDATVPAIDLASRRIVVNPPQDAAEPAPEMAPHAHRGSRRSASSPRKPGRGSRGAKRRAG
jgi:16S rRNA processing protein RimM